MPDSENERGIGCWLIPSTVMLLSAASGRTVWSRVKFCARDIKNDVKSYPFLLLLAPLCIHWRCSTRSCRISKDVIVVFRNLKLYLQTWIGSTCSYPATEPCSAYTCIHTAKTVIMQSLAHLCVIWKPCLSDQWLFLQLCLHDSIQLRRLAVVDTLSFQSLM